MTVSGLDGKVTLKLGTGPIPLLEEDFQALEGELPGYDAVGRGIYQTLRTDPGCLHCEHYAALLKQGYLHYVSELASHILMLGEKDVEVPYLDRRVKLLQIFALMEPKDAHFLLEIGTTLLDKGCRFSALQLSTVTLFQAESYLERALELAPADQRGASALAEVCYLLGKYQKAAALWRELLPTQSAPAAEALNARLESIGRGELPRVPAVDYLEAVACALLLKEEGGCEEAAAILRDIMADEHFAREFPMPEIPYLLALCCLDMGGARDARSFLRQALRIDPDFAEAQSALEKLEG